MSREIRRVPLNFGWPLNKRWEGFIKPEWLNSLACDECKMGYSRAGQRYYEEWYGYVPFDPASNGSPLLTHETPEVEDFARRNVLRDPGYYGDGEEAVKREGERLAKLWNGYWSHHLSQEDVDALFEADALLDFTHTWDSEIGWVRKQDAVKPSAAEVNAWTRGGGLRQVSQSPVFAARAKREGVELLCAKCEGEGSVEAWGGQREAAEAWVRLDPPTGEGWQLWESVSEGSPVTPVFASAEDLASHLSSNSRVLGSRGGELTYAAALKWVNSSGWIPSAMVVDGELLSGSDLLS